MNKSIIIFIVSSAHILAMEIVPGKVCDIWNKIFIPGSPEKAREKNILDSIPLVLQGEIVKKMLMITVFQGDKFQSYIDRKKLNKKIWTITPLFLGHGYIRDFCLVMNKLVSSEFHKKCSLHQIYSLSLPERKIVMNIGSSRFSSGELFEDEYEVVKTMKFKEQFPLAIFPRSYSVYLLNGMAGIGMIGLSSGGLLILFSRCMEVDVYSPFFKSIGVVTFGGMTFCIAGLLLKELFVDFRRVNV